MLQENNYNLIRMLFKKNAINVMLSYSYRIVIRVLLTPASDHIRQYNAPTVDEVSIVMIEEEFHSHNIASQRIHVLLQ